LAVVASGRLEDELKGLIEGLVKEFEGEEELKDGLVALARRVVKASGDAVVAIHRGEEGEAAKLIEEAKAFVEEALSLVEKRPEYLHVGPLPQALKEYVEARLLLSLQGGLRLPRPNELKVPIKPYVYGLAEVAGEVKRLMVEAMRRDRLEEAEQWLKVLEALYMALRSLEAYRGALPGIKGAVDQVRKALEPSRSDLALMSQGQRLRLELRRFEEELRKLG